ncbi:MAG: hypothetical protein ABSB78_08415 [Bacteroidota bacterium]
MVNNPNALEIPLNLENFTTDDYHELWNHLGPIEIRMTEKCGKCKHALDDVFVYQHPYDKPAGVCSALLHVLDLYTWRVALGFPSWESDNRKVHRIHCPSKKGTVWEMKKLEK